jgi:hypothetical protein
MVRAGKPGRSPATEAETFRHPKSLIERTEHLCPDAYGRLEIAAKSQFGNARQQVSRCTRQKKRLYGVSPLILIDRRLLEMTKTTKALLTGAAFAGLFAGTASAAQASTLLPSLKTSFNAQDQSENQDKKDDKKVKEKHACKGQNSCKGKGGCKAGDNGCKGKNSCKGKGGCATDGSKPPAA